MKNLELVLYCTSNVKKDEKQKRVSNMKICLEIKLPAINSDTLLHLRVTFANYRKFLKVH